MEWMSAAPDWATLVLFMLIPAACAIGVHIVVRRYVSHERLIPHHDVAGFLVAIVGVLYAVVLGFVVVNVWSSFDDVQRTSDLEAGDVADAYVFASLLPDPPRTRVRALLASYAVEVLDGEWPALRLGKTDPQARAYLLGAVAALASSPPLKNATFGQALRAESTRQTVVNSVRDVSDNRRLRLVQAQQRLPAALYTALAFGAMMLLAFVFLFGVEDAVLQLTMTGIVAACIGLLLGVIVAFDSPFQGAIRVSPDAWASVVRNNDFRAVSAARPPQTTAP